MNVLDKKDFQAKSREKKKKKQKNKKNKKKQNKTKQNKTKNKKQKTKTKQNKKNKIEYLEDQILLELLLGIFIFWASLLFYFSIRWHSPYLCKEVSILF